MRGRLLGPEDPAWSRVLEEGAHDFHHLPGYARLSAMGEGGEPCALHVEDDGAAMLLPLVIRSTGDGRHDATSPYGYPGPIVAGDAGPTFVADALAEGTRVLRDAGIVSLFVRLHPLLNACIPDGVGVAIHHGDTVSVDLSRSPAALWQGTRRDHRNQINRSVRAGHRVRLDGTWEHLETFKRLYRATMERVDAEPYYFFTDEYFDGLFAAVGGRLRLAVVEIGDALAAAGLFVETSGIVQYHLSATDERFARQAPTKLMIHWIRAWAQDRGDRWLHLGGGVGASDDSLLRFKAGFSPLRQPFHTLRVVVMPEAYRELVAALDPSADPTRLDGFFPLYRRPFPATKAPRT